MRSLPVRLMPLAGWLRRSWAFLREVSGDDAYERYLAHHAGAHPGEAPLSRKEFYCREQDRKWSGPRRCC